VVRTILALAPAAHLYFFTAAGAVRRVWHIGFRMLVPPFHSAGIGAEAPTTAHADINRFSALHTPSGFFLSDNTFLPATIRLYRIFGKPKFPCNLYISDATLSHGSDSFSLLICHEIVLQSEDLCPHYPMEVKVPFGRKVREIIAHNIRLHAPQDRKVAFERKKGPAGFSPTEP
jgi:hypothetical protein